MRLNFESLSEFSFPNPWFEVYLLSILLTLLILALVSWTVLRPRFSLVSDTDLIEFSKVLRAFICYFLGFSGEFIL